MKREKTVVEFLYEFVLLKLTNEQQMQFEGLFQQAKAMEKDQLKEAYSEDRPMLSYFEDGSAFEEYYNETYGDEEHD